MKRALLLFFLMGVFELSWAQDSLFYGDIVIKVKTTVPGFSFDAKTTKKVSLSIKEERVEIQRTSLKIEPKIIDTGIKLRNKHMIDKVFKGKPILFKSSETNCFKEKPCAVKGQLTVGEASKDIVVNVAWSSRKEFSFEKNLSLKEMEVQKLGFLKVEVKDEISILGSFKQKN